MGLWQDVIVLGPGPRMVSGFRCQASGFRGQVSGVRVIWDDGEPALKLRPETKN